MTCTFPKCDGMPVAACGKKFHCDTHQREHALQVTKEEARSKKAATMPNTPPPRCCAGMGPNRPHFTNLLAEAMDNRKEKALVGNAVRFSKPIPDQTSPNSNQTSPQTIITPKLVNVTKSIPRG